MTSRSSRHEMPTEWACIRVQDSDGGVRLITLNRPAKRNAMNTQMVLELLNAFQAAASDTSVGSVLLAGAGDLFCAGGDLHEFGSRSGTDGEIENRTNLNASLIGLLTRLRIPIVCAVHGKAVGGGAALALATDFVVMGRSATFSYPEAKQGLVGGIVIANLVHHIGRKAAFEALLLGTPIEAHTAARLGLATKVVPDEEVMSSAFAAARRLAEVPRSTMAMTKSLMYSAASSSIDDALMNGVKTLKLLRARESSIS